MVIYFQDADNDNAEHMEEDIDGDLADIEALNYDDLDSVSKLQNTQRYTDIMQVSLVYTSCVVIVLLRSSNS